MHLRHRRKGLTDMSNNDKERLTVVVGAGASVQVGCSSTESVTRSLIEKVDRALSEVGWGERNLVGMLKKHLEGYCDDVNFEHLMHALEFISTIQRSRGSNKSKENRFVNKHGSMEAKMIGGLHPEIQSFLDGCDGDCVNEAIEHIHRDIMEIFSNESKNADRSPLWTEYVQFWSSLGREFNLDIVTTNYDICIENAFRDANLPELVNGFIKTSGECSPEFNSSALRSSSESRIMHLHGSVQFSSRISHEQTELLHDLCFFEDPSRAVTLFRPGFHNQNQAGRDVTLGPIVTGLNKLDKLMHIEPYATYYRQFIDCLQGNRNLLLIGYGGGDQHINSGLRRVKQWHDNRRKVMILGKTEPIRDNGSNIGWKVPHWVSDPNGFLWHMTDFPRHLSSIIRRQMFLPTDLPLESDDRCCKIDLDGFLIEKRNRAEDVLSFLQ